MTPKERAVHIFNTHEKLVLENTKGTTLRNLIKDSSMVTIDEIITTLKYDIGDKDMNCDVMLMLLEYWEETKKELEKL